MVIVVPACLGTPMINLGLLISVMPNPQLFQWDLNMFSTLLIILFRLRGIKFLRNVLGLVL